MNELQSQKWNTIKSARDQNLSAGFTWNGKVFDSDPESQARIQGAVQLAGLSNSPDFKVDWTLADNSVITLTASDLAQVGLALGTFVQNVFAQGRALRDQIDAATDQATLDAITWTTITQ